MLYLAEVQKKTRAFGSSKSEFKLLACQRAEYSWSAVSDETISAPDDVPYGNGALVLVTLNNGRNVQRHSLASKQLVTILQNFSRLQDKFKGQEDEIEQWKQSLTYQSQELNRRELELDTRQEQVQDIEVELEQLEQQRQEIETARTEVDRLQEEFNRKSEELDGAWAQLNGAKRQFEEQQGSQQAAGGLDTEHAQHIGRLLDELSQHTLSLDSARSVLDQANGSIAQQQETLDHYWQELEQKRQQAQSDQGAIDRGEGAVQWDEWHVLREAVGGAQVALEGQRQLLQAKQNILTTLLSKMEQHQQLQQLIATVDAEAGSAGGSAAGKVDIAALEQMPIDELQTMVQDLKQDLEKNAKFVSIQEEELNAQQQDIEELKQRIAEASEYDRLQMENELNDEQESYQMLNKTLVGQRRNVQEREAVLLQHERVLARRQGLPLPGNENASVDLQPITTVVDAMGEQLSKTIATVEAEINELEQAIAQQQDALHQQEQDLGQKKAELQEQEQAWTDRKTATAELWGTVNTYQALLQSWQEALNGVRDRLNDINTMTSQWQATVDQQSSSVASMQETVRSLTTV